MYSLFVEKQLATSSLLTESLFFYWK